MTSVERYQRKVFSVKKRGNTIICSSEPKPFAVRISAPYSIVYFPAAIQIPLFFLFGLLA